MTPILSEEGGWASMLSRLVAGESLQSEEAAAALGLILEGKVSDAQMSAFVTALRMRGETVEEMSGMVTAMLKYAHRLDIAGTLVDTCGTGGDGRHTINVSTVAALVVAGAGALVCKHGGRGASSSTGSADVLQELGVVVDLGPAGVERCVKEAGMGFCFAPRFHPAMRHAAPVRKQLGIATVFNFLGPLANPARAKRQVVGVSDPSLAEKMLGVLISNGAERSMVVWGDDGLDELSTTGPSTVLDYDKATGVVSRYSIDPLDHGLKRATLDDLRGGDSKTNAKATRTIISGELGPKRDIVVLNAAAALIVAGLCSDFDAGVKSAQQSIDGGHAADALDRLIATSRQASEAGG